MTKTTKALAWAGILMALAVASLFGLVKEDLAQTLIIVLPLVAWMNISGNQGCAPCRLAKAPQA